MPHKEGRREREKCANAGMGENVLVGGEINEITDNFEKLDALDNLERTAFAKNVRHLSTARF
jgi:hypothetical protein